MITPILNIITNICGGGKFQLHFIVTIFGLRSLKTRDLSSDCVENFYELRKNKKNQPICNFWHEIYQFDLFTTIIDTLSA